MDTIHTPIHYIHHYYAHIHYVYRVRRGIWSMCKMLWITRHTMSLEML